MWFRKTQSYQPTVKEINDLIDQVNRIETQRSSEAHEHERSLAELEHGHKMEIATLNNDNQLALKEKEFELKHFKDEEVQGLQAQVNALEQDKAVLTKENEMLIKITDLNSDVIDVKELVTKLIDKLPEVKISSLALPSGHVKE